MDGQLIDYPFSFNYDETVNSDGSITVNNISDQKLQTAIKPFVPNSSDEKNVGELNGVPIPYVYGIGDEVASQDALYYDASGNFTGHAGHSSQTYVQANSYKNCYSRTLTSANLALTSLQDGTGCNEVEPLIDVLLNQVK